MNLGFLKTFHYCKFRIYILYEKKITNKTNHTCNSSTNLRKSANYLLVNSWNSTNPSFHHHGIPRSLKFLITNFYETIVSRFRIFGFFDSIIILKNKYSTLKTKSKYLKYGKCCIKQNKSNLFFFFCFIC